MTIDVALLRQLAAWPNTSLVAHGPVVLLKPTTVTELLDAYEERERLRTALGFAVSMIKGGEVFHVAGCDGCDSIKRALEGRE